MIEIIKKGTKEKCICKECGCVFTYEVEDIEEQYNHNDVPAWYRQIKKIIRCPQCETVITLEATR